jgi:hypothetical protein
LQELRGRFYDELAPVGPLEEMLVEQIVTAYWRLRRALTAETGEITLSVDGGQHQRDRADPITKAFWLAGVRDMTMELEASSIGNLLLAGILGEVREMVERDGEVNEAALAHAKGRLGDKPNTLLGLLKHWQAMPVAEPGERKSQTLRAIDRELAHYDRQYNKCKEREQSEEESRQSASVLPAAATLDKIMRYEAALERQLYRAMAQLERLQRRRSGENIPAPLAMEIGMRG